MGIIEEIPILQNQQLNLRRDGSLHDKIKESVG
jgi:hypothetical protein